MTRVSAVIRTNASSVDTKAFLKATSDYLTKRLKVDAKNLSLELHTKVPIIRDGCFDTAMNIDVHHNTDDINNTTKAEIAEDLADFVNKQVKVDTDRVLVLFFDTRKCT